ncbi:hypothetical protein WA026_016636 [Henosepilachna vigintioctopunctata]|uniref:Uncharacterized protein n=1 Tax=Henosepilachna vigintioctopunctata TaxID=420089 RepID=A0AAW1UGJ8_9CUCU
MKKYLFYIVISGFFLSVKSHVIKALILAVLGLTGLWLLHLLAQDYQQIQRPNKKLLFKRSLDYQPLDYTTQWSTIWSNDPIGCVRSFICQIAANETSLDDYSIRILNLARISVRNKISATEELEKAIGLGEANSNGNICFDTYKLCPFSAGVMMKILAALRSSTI